MISNIHTATCFSMNPLHGAAPESVLVQEVWSPRQLQPPPGLRLDLQQRGLEVQLVPEQEAGAGAAGVAVLLLLRRGLAVTLHIETSGPGSRPRLIGGRRGGEATRDLLGLDRELVTMNKTN